MTLTITEYKHIQLNEKNVPIIAGTSMKVVELITSVKAYQWTPEELVKLILKKSKKRSVMVKLLKIIPMINMEQVA